MKTMQWLIRREYWENKGSLVVVPLVLAALMIVFTAVMALKGQNATFSINTPDGTVSSADVLMGARQQRAVTDVMATAYPLVAAPLYLAMAFTVFFYCMNSLYGERRDRSLLFWKSLPVSDTATVLSKAALALLLIPLGTVVLALATAIVITMIGLGVLAANGPNLLPQLLGSGQVWLTAVKLVSLLPVYMLWALPTVGWLLMVSSWARSKVFLWAVGAPLITAALLAWANKMGGLAIDVEWLFQNVISRLLISVVPGSWFSVDTLHVAVENAGRATRHNDPSGVLDAIYTQSWAALGTPHLWLGVLAGVVMIGVAIWMRQRREEV